jgi:hypothetical protein
VDAEDPECLRCSTETLGSGGICPEALVKLVSGALRWWPLDKGRSSLLATFEREKHFHKSLRSDFSFEHQQPITGKGNVDLQRTGVFDWWRRRRL